jgi:hypothetical protein
MRPTVLERQRTLMRYAQALHRSIILMTDDYNNDGKLFGGVSK